MIPCTGEFQLNISSNWTVVTQDNPDVVVSRLTDGLLVGSINNAVGSFYASVSTLKPSSSHQIFQFYTVFTESKSIIPKTFRPGNNGLLTWEDKEEKQIEVSWKPVEDASGKPIEQGITYHIYFSEESSSNILTSCGTHYYSTLEKVQHLESTTNFSAVVDLPSIKGFINVIADVPRNSSSPLKEIIYDPMEVISIGSPSAEDLLIFWLLATLLFLSVAVAIYFYRKKLAADSLLRYEMNDVRNMANMSSLSEMQNIKRKDPYEKLST